MACSAANCSKRVSSFAILLFLLIYRVPIQLNLLLNHIRRNTISFFSFSRIINSWSYLHQLLHALSLVNERANTSLFLSVNPADTTRSIQLEKKDPRVVDLDTFAFFVTRCCATTFD